MYLRMSVFNAYLRMFIFKAPSKTLDTTYLWFFLCVFFFVLFCYFIFEKKNIYIYINADADGDRQTDGRTYMG